MNRETTLHFGAVPRIHSQRSKINMSHSVHTAFNVGDIVPIYVDSDIMPGDTVELDLSSVTRLATPIVPVMDNLILDIYCFFVPHRLVWEHWEQFWGQNDDPWTQTTTYTIPQITSPASTGWTLHSLADYMGIPIGITDISVSALPFRAYAKIWSDYFRDENLKYASHIYTDDTTRTGTNGTNYVTDPELGGAPCKGAKTHDMFTSALPTPQKGPSVAVPIGTEAPIKPGTTMNYNLNDSTNPLKWSEYDSNYKITSNNPLGGAPSILFVGNTETGAAGQLSGQTPPLSASRYVVPGNLKADLSNATSATINELRTAFAIQKYYEACARYGTRYIELIRAIFQTDSSDARLQRAEYLGGTRIPVNMSAIVQTSSTDATSPQGNASGYSCTLNYDSLFTKSFEEHGTFMVLALCRVEKRSYQQGLHKMWTRKSWKDYYNPFFANLGEMPIYNQEIYCQGRNSGTINPATGKYWDEEVFGYQEAWAEYRYRTNLCTADMRSTATTSLDIYHYGDDYNALPTLGSTWIDEDKSVVDRTIAVTSQRAHQLLSDNYLKMYYTRVMPVYSMPGLIDHV